MMKQEDAQKAILNEWLKLPETERRTEKQVVSFTIKIMKDRPDITNFKCSGDRYQIIKGFLFLYLSNSDIQFSKSKIKKPQK
jgi:hypothetical protein